MRDGGARRHSWAARLPRFAVYGLLVSSIAGVPSASAHELSREKMYAECSSGAPSKRAEVECKRTLAWLLRLGVDLYEPEPDPVDTAAPSPGAPGAPLLEAQGFGIANTEPFVVEGSSLEVEWSADGSEALIGCSFYLHLKRTDFATEGEYYDPPWGFDGAFMQAGIATGEIRQGVAYVYGLVPGEYFIGQEGLGDCSWSFVVRTR